ncbi:Uncharacterized protein Rs2_27372 [Raphanus sativus]|nr:hypothetical protein Rs2_48677 [Raphanus sativus]KAJ4887624.1 Uncharacterized protein Rs2_27372 [Raphanus sativus]
MGHAQTHRLNGAHPATCLISSRTSPRVQTGHRSRHASPFHRNGDQTPEKAKDRRSSATHQNQTGESPSPSSLPTNPFPTTVLEIKDCVGNPNSGDRRCIIIQFFAGPHL